MNNLFDNFQIHMGDYVETFIKWLTRNYESFFDAIRDGILWFLLHIQDIMLAIPWFIFILAIILISWKLVGLKSGIVFGIMLFLVGSMGYWETTMMTLSLVLSAVIISLMIGIPLGILLSYSNKANSAVRPILDAMQTMPSFVYLIPAIMFFGLGSVPAVFAITIYSLPPVIRLTTLAIKSVNEEMKEAADAFGCSVWQKLIKVELPQAIPTIMAGVNQTTMMAMAMVVISSMIGAKGLGYDVLVAINRTDIAQGFEAGISIVFLAIIIDRLTQSVGKKYNFSE